MTEPRIGIFDIFRSMGAWKMKSLKLVDHIFGSCLAFVLPQRTNPNVTTDEWKNILIIRPGGIGDAVFLLPFLKALRREFPVSAIDILCEKRNRKVFSSQKNLADHVYCYDLNGGLKKIFKNRYDLIIDTEQWHYASALVAYFLNPKRSIGFGTRALRAKLLNKAVDYSSDAYEMENFRKLFVEILKNLDEIQTTEGSFNVEKENLTWAQEMIPAESVTVFLGASIALRRLTHDQTLEIIRFILKENVHAALLGGHDVKEAGTLIEREIKDRRLHNFVAKTSLLQSVALIKRSKVFVGPDSGLLHLACALKTPTVAIFGPGNLKKWSPQGKKHSIVTENVECSPCTRFGYTVPTCRASYHCMKNIDIKNVLAACKKTLQMDEHL